LKKSIDTPLSVLHVVAGLAKNSGGPSRCVPEECLALAKSGIRVGLAFRFNGEELSSEFESLSNRLLEKIPLKGPLYLNRLWSCVSSYDIIHINGIWSPFCHFASWFSRIQGKPLLTTTHGMLEPWSLRKKRFKKIMGYRLFQEEDLQKSLLLRATGDSEARNLRNFGLKPPIAVIPNGVSVPVPQKPSKKNRGKKRLLFLSRVHPKKGVLELVRAVSSLRDIFEEKGWFLTICGPDEGGHLKEVEKEVGKLEIGKWVEFLAPVEGREKWDLYKSALLFVLPTFSENFGIVVAEALGCGVPVITTQETPWEELNKFKCGWWYPVGQENLESVLRAALAVPDGILKKMGDRGRKLIVKKYGWERIGVDLKKSYEWVLGQGVRPDFVKVD
jgi:glycosyltransferase involved in cell wall biosynthesis